MKRCPQCAVLFENRETTCPQCGCELKKEKKSLRFILNTIFFLIAATLSGILLSIFL